MTPHLGEAQPHHNLLDAKPSAYYPFTAPNKVAFAHKGSAPAATKKSSKTGRDYDYSHIKSRLAPAARQKQRKPRDSKKKAAPASSLNEPAQSATYDEEAEDLVEMDDLQNSYVVDAKSFESRGNLTRTERQPKSKGSQRAYLGAQDNSSNKNTAKNTDGTASDAHFGFTGRGVGGVAAFTPSNNRNTGINKTSPVNHHRTSRPGKPKRRDHIGEYDEEDQDARSAGAARSSDVKAGPNRPQKSASYLNMTSSFKNKVGPPPLMAGGRSEARNNKASKSQVFDHTKDGKLQSQPNLRAGGKPGTSNEQNPRSAGQGGGRQPTQKKR